MDVYSNFTTAQLFVKFQYTVHVKLDFKITENLMLLFNFNLAI